MYSSSASLLSALKTCFLQNYVTHEIRNESIMTVSLGFRVRTEAVFVYERLKQIRWQITVTLLNCSPIPASDAVNPIMVLTDQGSLYSFFSASGRQINCKSSLMTALKSHTVMSSLTKKKYISSSFYVVYLSNVQVYF